MARDVEVDILLQDKTGPGIKSVERNLKSASDTAEKVNSTLGKGLAQWGAGFSKLGDQASKWANSGDTAGKRFAQGIGKGLSKVAELGGAVGASVSKAVTAAGPQVALAASAVLVGAAVAAAPAVGAAVVGAAGLGGLVGGVMLASKDARVKAAFSDLGEEAGRDLQNAAGRFVPATLAATKEARKAFQAMLPDLKRIFDVSATWLPGLTASVGRGAEAAVAGIAQAITKAGPIITVIGQGVEGIGKAVGQTFGMLADNGSSMALALKGVFWMLESSIRGAGAMLNLLVEGFEFFVNKIPGGKKLLDSMVASQDGAKASTFNLAGGFQALAGDANKAAAGLTNAQQKADELVNSNIGLARSQIASRDATRQAAEAITQNSNAKMTNQQRADANKASLLNMAQAFNQETAAGEKSGLGAGKASAAYATNREALIKMAQKANLSKVEAEKLAASLLRIPNNVHTDINASTAKAFKQLETFQKKVNGLKGKTITIVVKTNGDHYIPGVGTQLHRWGGIDHHMAAGGMIESHFAKAPTVLYGERATGGEAFIPRRGDLGRSRGIAEKVVRDWLGGDVQWGNRRGGRGGGGGVVVENLTVKAYSDRFSLRQVMSDLAMQGVH
ncbi:hypothetical protein [Micromonospora sp. DH14]|uniref:hypothetical protein n=1 Tax=Micromonospora sp. DH14 TaxID=3040120 RepID=UPI00244103AD|nr:hypothetical protein [Micromonospora sp. DH14]MDG9673031.1 hypothetical protein [Micromonospora sp. DH14]